MFLVESLSIPCFLLIKVPLNFLVSILDFIIGLSPSRYLLTMTEPRPESVLNLLDGVNSNKKLSSRLDLDVPIDSRKRKPSSPLKVKKYNKSKDGKTAVVVNCESNSANAHEETLLSDPMSVPSTSGHFPVRDNSGSSDEDVLDQLEEILCEEPGSDDSENNSSTESDDLELLGVPKESTWKIPEKVRKFFIKASDIDLSKEVIEEIKSKYTADEELQKHFAPPRFSPSLWSTVQGSPSDVFRLKSILKIQENLFLSIKPLLDCLSSVDKDSKKKISESIQLICSSNLQLNRFRRATIAPYLKPELRKQVLALPVTHDSFFGNDFSKVTDDLIKEQSSLDKIIVKKPVSQRISQKPQHDNRKQFFRGQRGGKFYSGGRGSNRGYPNNSKRYNQRSTFRPRQSGSNSFPQNH